MKRETQTVLAGGLIAGLIGYLAVAVVFAGINALSGRSPFHKVIDERPVHPTILSAAEFAAIETRQTHLSAEDVGRLLASHGMLSEDLDRLRSASSTTEPPHRPSV